MKETYQDFLDRLKEERLRLELSQDEMGRLLRMTQSHYSKAEHGAKRFTYYETQCICDTDVDVYYLFTGHRNKNVIDEYWRKKSSDELKHCLNILCQRVAFLNEQRDIELSDEEQRKIGNIQNSQIKCEKHRTGLFWLRTFLDYNQFKMAELLEIDVKKLRNLEEGKLLPDSEMIWKMWDKFQVPYFLILNDKKGMLSEIHVLMDFVVPKEEEALGRYMEYMKEFVNEAAKLRM